MTAPAQSPSAPDVMAAFADPSAIGGDRPAARDMVGRVVVIRPTRFEPNVPGVEPGKTQDRITADVLVVDGGPMEFGGNPRRGKPNTLTVQTPYLVKDMYISNGNLVKAVKDQVGIGVVLGRIHEGKASNPAHNNPYNLIGLQGDDPMRAAAAQLYTQVMSRTFTNPEPQKIGAGAVASAPVAASFPQHVAPAMPPAPPAPVQAAAPAPVAPVETPEQAAQRAFAEWQAAQAAAQAPTAPAAEIPEPPAGWDRTIWASLQPEQRAAVLNGAPPFK